jgi:hypothetical protein
VTARSDHEVPRVGVLVERCRAVCVNQKPLCASDADQPIAGHVTGAEFARHGIDAPMREGRQHVAAYRAIRLVQPGLVQFCCVRTAVHVAEVSGKYHEVFRASAASVDALEAQNQPARGCQFGEA